MVILAMRYAIETSGLMVITTFIDLTRTTMVYRLAYIKKSGNRLSRCPDFADQLQYTILGIETHI